MNNTFKQLTEFIEQGLERLPYPSEPANLYEPIKYTMCSGGKRLRPVLLLATMMAYDKYVGKGLSHALGLEMFHNFTLLHDDVMDNADVRRGRPTVHRRWDANTAILSGDAMLTMATRLMGDCDDCHLRAVMEVFNRTAMQIYEGQQYDMDFESRNDVSVDEYINMIRLKTSVLLGCACYIGAVLSDAGDYDAEQMYEYGMQLGIAFQLRDDYLDTYGDPAVFGKAIGGDILNDKKTWLLINALTEDKSGVIENAIGGTIEGEAKIDAVRGVYDALGLPARINSLIEEYEHKALEALGRTSMSESGREFFEELAHEMTGRQK